LGGGEGGYVDVFILCLVWVAENGGDGAADGGYGGGAPFVVAGVEDGGGVVVEVKAEETNLETPIQILVSRKLPRGSGGAKSSAN